MAYTESELTTQLIEAILSIVVEVEGATVHLGDLNGRTDSRTFGTVVDANKFAESARLDALNRYKEVIYDDRENIRERLKKLNELDR